MLTWEKIIDVVSDAIVSLILIPVNAVALWIVLVYCRGAEWAGLSPPSVRQIVLAAFVLFLVRQR